MSWLAFDHYERGPHGDRRFQLEATMRLDPEERKALPEFIDAFLLTHKARRYVATS